jgi:putative ABC transport system permease protein
MALTDFTIIRRSMTSRLFSTVTTILTVAVAAGLMLVLLSMRDAGRKAFERGAGNMHLLVSADSAALPAILNGIFYANPPQRPIAWDKYEQLAASFPWEYAIPMQMGDSYRGQPVAATSREFFTKFKPDVEFGWTLAQGRFFENDFEVVAGAAAAKAARLNIGDRIALTHGAGSGVADTGGAAEHVHEEYTYAVVGVLGPTGTPHDRALFTNLESAWIIHANDRLERQHSAEGEEHDAHSEEAEADHAEEDHAEHEEHELAGRDDLTPEDRKITGIYLRLLTRPGSDATAALAQVFDQLRRDPTITVAQPAQQINNLFRIVSNIDQIFLGLAGVVMASSGIAVMLALYNSMEQRRRQIAVLRVLGCSRPRIFGLVLTESAMLGLLGAALGLILCVIGAWIVATIMKRELGLVIQPTMDARWTLVVVVATILLASLAGVIPSAMAYRTSVARNLKPLG